MAALMSIERPNLLLSQPRHHNIDYVLRRKKEGGRCQVIIQNNGASAVRPRTMENPLVIQAQKDKLRMFSLICESYLQLSSSFCFTWRTDGSQETKKRSGVVEPSKKKGKTGSTEW